MENLSILTLAQYVNNSIDIIVKLKIEAALIDEKKERENVKISSDEEWEALLIKEEANIRKHISFILGKRIMSWKSMFCKELMKDLWIT